MSSSTFVLYHAFRALADPEAVGLWQQELGGRLGLTGRVDVGPQGLQGVVGGRPDRLAEYAAATGRHPALADVTYGWAEGRTAEGGTAELATFRVTVRGDVWGLGAAECRVLEQGGGGAARHLTPAQVHALVAARGEDVVFLDGRQFRESAVGRFRGARLPSALQARDVLEDLQSGGLDELKHRPVVTYCTDGARSEVLTALLADRGFVEPYLIEGGIVSYGQTFADDGLWEGSLYVLGEQVQIVFSEHPSVVGRCEGCGAPTSCYRPCVASVCPAHALLCNGCADFALCLAHRN